PGLAAVLNTGLARIASPLVARADADDRYAPDRLARQVAEFDRRSDLVGLSCGYHRITEDGARVLTHRPVTGAAIIRFRAMFSNSLLHPGIVLRRAAVARVGGYDPAYWTAQDSDLWARLMAAGGALDNLPDPLVEWREHGGSVLSKRGPEGKALSLTVSRRLQEAYLGRALEPQTVAAAVETWRSYSPLPFDTLRRGAAHLARILDAARRQEEAEVIRDFERKMAASFLRQARFALRRKPGTALRLGARAMAWRQGRPSERDAA
ncbi:MAG: glycosyltransferase, partial [Pseudomonadota bacterium]